MKAADVGEAAVELPWLAPCAASLVALARGPTADAWDILRRDPGAVLLLVRHLPDDGDIAASVRDVHVLETAVALLDKPGFVDWNQSSLGSLFAAVQMQAAFACALGRRVDGCDPERAWIGGLLAPLGWLAVAAVAPPHLETCRAHPTYAKNPADAQSHCWGLDATAIARRLARSWNLPAWLGTIVGHLGLPLTIARSLGAEPRVFQTVQLAVRFSQEQAAGVDLAVGASVDELRDALGLSLADVEQAWAESKAAGSAVPMPLQAPGECALLGDLLNMALDSRRRTERQLVERLQNDVDQLQRALESQYAGERERLHVQKLAALAEFAAGAGHEINNPLAVISGQAQYLLRKVGSGQWIVGGSDSAEALPPPEDLPLTASLQTIVKQAQRIHQIVKDLMQFARPSPAQKQTIDVAALVRAVTEPLQELAQQRHVRLVTADIAAGLEVLADGGQLRQALAALLRNAIEAAPAEGWAGIRTQLADDGTLAFHVEDSGPGPSPAVQAHMFDPFYSGRNAGRGRGLGLATAWRLARHHGGDVQFAGHVGGVTQFVLRMPNARCQTPSAEVSAAPQAASQNGTTIIVCPR